MSDRVDGERRRHVRHPLATTVQFYHGPSQREYPARSVDISHGGMLLFVPVSTPVAAGQPVRVKVGAHNRPELEGLNCDGVDATIVRVDRRRIMDMGYVPVGVRFAAPVGRS